MDADWIGSLSERRSISGYVTFVDIILSCGEVKKHNVTAELSDEAEYTAMTHFACEIMWIRNLEKELSIRVKKPMSIFFYSMHLCC